MSMNQTLVYCILSTTHCNCDECIEFSIFDVINKWTASERNMYRIGSLSRSHISAADEWVHACIMYIDIQNSYIFTVCSTNGTLCTQTHKSQLLLTLLMCKRIKFCLQNGKKIELCCVKFESLRLHASQVTTKYLHIIQINRSLIEPISNVFSSLLVWCLRQIWTFFSTDWIN